MITTAQLFLINYNYYRLSLENKIAGTKAPAI